MTEDYRGSEPEAGISAWLRHRWKYGSVLVVNRDHTICSPDLTDGLIIEWKHETAKDKTWRITRHIADKCGWYAALFVYYTADRDPRGEPTRIIATTYRNHTQHGPFQLDPDWFDQWVCDHLGAQPREKTT